MFFDPGVEPSKNHSSGKVRATGWKVYFWLWLLMFISLTLVMYSRSGPTTLDFVITVVNVWCLVGLYGFAFRKPIFHQSLWRVAVFVVVVWNSPIWYTFHPSISSVPSALGMATGFLLLLALYIALYRYAFHSEEIWRSETEGIMTGRWTSRALWALTFLGAFAFAFFLGARSTPQVFSGDITQNWSEGSRSLALEMAPWMTNVRGVRFGEFEVVFPSERYPTKLMLTRGPLFFVHIDEDGIYIDSKGRELVNIRDNDNDGIYDELSYDFVDESGEVVGWLTDFGTDGQPNQRIHRPPKGSSAPSKFFWWIDDGWRQLVEKDGADQVEIDGVWRKVDHIDIRHGHVVLK